MENRTLYHHGILGQKWGKRNGPPYPLKPEDHSKAEKEAAKKKFTLSDRQKKFIKIGAVIVAAGLATYGAYKVSDYLRIRKSIEIGSNPKDNYIKSSDRIKEEEIFEDTAFLDRQFDYYIENYYENRVFNSLNDIPKSTSDYFNDLFDKHDYEKLYSGNNLNSDYSINSNRIDNCFNSVSSLIMRLKGYETVAAPSASSKGFNIDTAKRIFEGSSIEWAKNDKTSDLTNQLLNRGNNRYGYLDIQWKLGRNRHSLLYAVINNRLVFIDGQHERVYSPDDLFKLIEIDSTRFLDVTDFNPNEYILGALNRTI